MTQAYDSAGNRDTHGQQFCDTIVRPRLKSMAGLSATLPSYNCLGTNCRRFLTFPYPQTSMYYDIWVCRWPIRGQAWR